MFHIPSLILLLFQKGHTFLMEIKCASKKCKWKRRDGGYIEAVGMCAKESMARVAEEV